MLGVLENTKHHTSLLSLSYHHASTSSNYGVLVVSAPVRDTPTDESWASNLSAKLTLSR